MKKIFYILLLLFSSCNYYSNQDLFEELQSFYEENPAYLEWMVRELDNLHTIHSTFYVSMGRRVMFSTENVDSIDFELPLRVNNIIRKSSVAGVRYVKKSYYSIILTSRTNACDSHHNVALVYSVRGVDHLLKGHIERYQGYLVLQPQQPIPENRCKLIKVLNKHWFMQIY